MISAVKLGGNTDKFVPNGFTRVFLFVAQVCRALPRAANLRAACSGRPPRRRRFRAIK